MRLADFILANTEQILAEWEAFARSVWPGAATDQLALRDHAEGILRATASVPRRAARVNDRFGSGWSTASTGSLVAAQV